MIRFQNGATPSPPRAGIPDAIRLHQPADESIVPHQELPAKFFALAMTDLKAQMAKVAQMIEDQSRPVDEYQPMTLTAEATQNVSVPPQWEVTEKIHSVLILGPAGPVTVQLGDRTWNLVIPASQFLLISPVLLILSRQDARILTAATPGQYNLELMGYCDERAS